MSFVDIVKDDLDGVFFDIEEFGVEIALKLDNQEDETFIGIFDIQSELIIDNEVVGHQPSILVTQEIEEKINHRSILVIEGKEYNKSHTDDENADLIRIFLERA